MALARRRDRMGLVAIVLGLTRLRAAWAGPDQREIVTMLYRGLLGREPDPAGLAGKLEALRSGASLLRILREFMESPEFRSRMLRELVPTATLPDLTRLMPDHYRSATADLPLLYLAHTDDDIALMASLIRKHRYYDRVDVWSPVIDVDKEIIAAIIRGLGAHSCFEVGCFTGPVLSLLADAGLAVAGCDISHHAFAFAYPNLRDAMIFGDLADIEIDRKFEAILCMDVLEHLNPLRFDQYLAKLVTLLDDDGWIYVNAPMFGRDEVFGTAADPGSGPWAAVGDSAFWREWPCDESGWPLHGHLVWASPNWWAAQFAAHGLRRDTTVERIIHYRLAGFFEQSSGRRSLFVLRHPNSRRSSTEAAGAVDRSLAVLPGLAAAPPPAGRQS